MILHDADIREPLFDFLEGTFGKIRILEEKVTGRSRADVVMVAESSIYGIEIKSDADTYARLSRQVKDYDKFFNFNYVVAGTKHAMHIREHVPAHWGVITVEAVDGEADFYILRKAQPNPNMRIGCKLRFLWRPELSQIQERHGMPKYKEKGKEFVIARIVERLQYPPDKKGYINLAELEYEISDILMERDYTLAGQMVHEYYKGELQKQIEKEKDPERQIALMMEQAIKKQNAVKRKKRRKII